MNSTANMDKLQHWSLTLGVQTTTENLVYSLNFKSTLSDSFPVLVGGQSHTELV
jgi:hypothetical protein